MHQYGPLSGTSETRKVLIFLNIVQANDHFTENNNNKPPQNPKPNTEGELRQVILTPDCTLEPLGEALRHTGAQNSR